jgi:hypothetical protein
LPKFVEEDGRGGGDVEGVDRTSHREVGEVVAEGFDLRSEAKVLRAEEEGGDFESGGGLEGDGVRRKAGADESVGLAKFVEVGEKIRRLTDRKAEEVAGGSADGFGVEGRGPFPDEDAGAAEGGGVSDDGPEISRVGNLGKDDEGAFFKGGKRWVFRLSGNGKVTAMEVETEEGGGFFTGEVMADADDFFDGVRGFL